MKSFHLLLSVFLLTLGSAYAQESPLRIEKPWVFQVPPTAKDTAAFMVLINDGAQPVRVVGGQTDLAKRVAPMVTTKHDGKMGMRDVDFIEVPAGGRTVLAPGGDHLMIYGLKEPLKAGQHISLTLKLAGEESVTVEVPVARSEPK